MRIQIFPNRGPGRLLDLPHKRKLIMLSYAHVLTTNTIFRMAMCYLNASDQRLSSQMIHIPLTKDLVGHDCLLLWVEVMWAVSVINNRRVMCVYLLEYVNRKKKQQRANDTKRQFWKKLINKADEVLGTQPTFIWHSRYRVIFISITYMHILLPSLCNILTSTI